MTNKDFSAALLSLGLGVVDAAKALGVGHGYVSMMCSGQRVVSDRIAGKVRQMIAEIPRLPAWGRCPRCGRTMRLKPSIIGSGVAVIHRCPAVDGVIIKTTIEPMGAPIEQVKAALGRRPGRSKTR